MQNIADEIDDLKKKMSQSKNVILTDEYKTTIEWGHSVYTDALDLALEAGVSQLGLFHLHQERTDKQMDQIVETCRRSIVEKGKSLECFAVACDSTFTL